MKRVLKYIQTYKGVKIYQYNDNNNYTATVYSNSFEKKDLKELKLKIVETINNHIKKFKNLD